MKRLFLICLSFICYSCYYLVEPEIPDSSKDYYFTYYNPVIFKNSDSCYVVGLLENEFSNNCYHINCKCKVYNDTIYITRRNSDYRFFNGIIYTRERPYRIYTELK